MGWRISRAEKSNNYEFSIFSEWTTSNLASDLNEIEKKQLEYFVY